MKIPLLVIMSEIKMIHWKNSFKLICEKKILFLARQPSAQKTIFFLVASVLLCSSINCSIILGVNLKCAPKIV